MGVGVEGERSPPAQPSSHIWSMASGCKNWLINAPQICSRAWSAQSELEVASRQGKHSQHRGVFLFQRCIWGFASRAVRKFLGTSAFASSPLWRAVGRNIARWSQNGESNQMRFAICDWTPSGYQERLRLGRPVRAPPHLASLQGRFHWLLNT